MRKVPAIVRNHIGRSRLLCTLFAQDRKRITHPGLESLDRWRYDDHSSALRRRYRGTFTLEKLTEAEPAAMDRS